MPNKLSIIFTLYNIYDSYVLIYFIFTFLSLLYSIYLFIFAPVYHLLLLTNQKTK